MDINTINRKRKADISAVPAAVCIEHFAEDSIEAIASDSVQTNSGKKIKLDPKEAKIVARGICICGSSKCKELMSKIAMFDINRAGYTSFPKNFLHRKRSNKQTIALQEFRRQRWLIHLGKNAAHKLNLHDADNKRSIVALTHFHPNIVKTFKTDAKKGIKPQSRFPSILDATLAEQCGYQDADRIANVIPGHPEFVLSPNYTFEDLENELIALEYMSNSISESITEGDHKFILDPTK